METWTQRPTWAGSLPSFASPLGSFSMECPFPFSTTSSLITTASSKLMSTLPSAESGERWTSCREPERRWLNAYLEATHSLLQDKRISTSLDWRNPWTSRLHCSLLKLLTQLAAERHVRLAYTKGIQLTSSTFKMPIWAQTQTVLYYSWPVPFSCMTLILRMAWSEQHLGFLFQLLMASAQYRFLDLNWLKKNFPQTEGVLIIRRVECYEKNSTSFGVRPTSQSASQLYPLSDLWKLISTSEPQFLQLLNVGHQAYVSGDWQ